MPDGAVARRTLAALAFTLLTWGSAFVGLRECLRSFSPGHLVLLRFASACAAYVFIAPPWKVKPPRLCDWPMVVFVGFLGTCAYHVLLNYGLQTVTAASGSLVTNTAPLWATVLAAQLLKERITARACVGLAMSLAGVMALSISQGHGLDLAPGIWLCLGAAFCWGLNIVVQKPMLQRMSPVQVSAYSVWAGSLGLLYFAPGIGHAVVHAPVSALLWVAYLGVVPVALAYVTWSYVLAHMPAGQASSWLPLIPVITAVVGWARLGETLSPMALLGGALAIAGVVVGATGRARQAPDG